MEHRDPSRLIDDPFLQRTLPDACVNIIDAAPASPEVGLLRDIANVETIRRFFTDGDGSTFERD